MNNVFGGKPERRKVGKCKENRKNVGKRLQPTVCIYKSWFLLMIGTFAISQIKQIEWQEMWDCRKSSSWVWHTLFSFIMLLAQLSKLPAFERKWRIMSFTNLLLEFSFTSSSHRVSCRNEFNFRFLPTHSEWVILCFRYSHSLFNGYFPFSCFYVSSGFSRFSKDFFYVDWYLMTYIG